MICARGAVLVAILAMVVPLSLSAGDWDRINSQVFHDDHVAASSEFPGWFKQSFLDLREDLADARRAGKRGVLLFLSQAQCSYCKMMIANTLSSSHTRDRLVGQFDVIGLEVIGDTELIDPSGRTLTMKQFVAREHAYVTPTMIFLDTRGQTLLRISGYYPPVRFAGVLDYVLDGHPDNQTLAEFLAGREPDSRQPGTAMVHDRTLLTRTPLTLDRRTAGARRPLLVLMDRPNCAACVRFHRRVLTDPKVRALVKRFEAVQLDISNDVDKLVTPDGRRVTSRQWARDLGVADTPTVVFFDESGREVFRLESELLAMRTAGAMQLVLEKGYRDEPQLQRWRNRKAAAGRETAR